MSAISFDNSQLRAALVEIEDQDDTETRICTLEANLHNEGTPLDYKDVAGLQTNIRLVLSCYEESKDVDYLWLLLKLFPYYLSYLLDEETTLPGITYVLPDSTIGLREEPKEKMGKTVEWNNLKTLFHQLAFPHSANPIDPLTESLACWRQCTSPSADDFKYTIQPLAAMLAEWHGPLAEEEQPSALEASVCRIIRSLQAADGDLTGPMFELFTVLFADDTRDASWPLRLSPELQKLYFELLRHNKFPYNVKNAYVSHHIMQNLSGISFAIKCLPVLDKPRLTSIIRRLIRHKTCDEVLSELLQTPWAPSLTPDDCESVFADLTTCITNQEHQKTALHYLLAQKKLTQHKDNTSFDIKNKRSSNPHRFTASPLLIEVQCKTKE